MSSNPDEIKTDDTSLGQALSAMTSSRAEDKPNTYPPAPNLQTLCYQSQNKTYLSQLYSQPILTTLSSFSQVADYVRNPYELLTNFDEYVKSSNSSQRKHQRTSENFARVLNQNKQPSTPQSPVLQEMDTFVADPHNQSATSSSDDQLDHERKVSSQESKETIHDEPHFPIPALPPIESSLKRGRLSPLTIEEYEDKLRQSSTDLELVERVFYGGMDNDTIRAALWPYLFDIVKYRGSFEKVFNHEGKVTHLYIEHKENLKRWTELRELYYAYHSQWEAILPDQENRFTAFRERKSLIERDVVRCDRLHSFYAENAEHSSTLTDLLMSYMMYDFDIGYVQGMSDLAGPILYMYRGDLIKSFWTFVEVMKLFRRNFEVTQKTIHFQLGCLHELIKNTDPMFVQYLGEHESSNCFFAFRPIVCLFKRELMKENEGDYSKVLFLWDTIWCVDRMNKLRNGARESELSVDKKKPTDEPGFYVFSPDQADTPRHKLTETEIFVLASCLSMVRRERDIIMAKRLDDTGIHSHFNDLKLANDIDGFIEHAINIYSFLKSDFDLARLTHPKPKNEADDGNGDSPPVSSEGYDLLNDFHLITGCPE